MSKNKVDQELILAVSAYLAETNVPFTSDTLLEVINTYPYDKVFYFDDEGYLNVKCKVVLDKFLEDIRKIQSEKAKEELIKEGTIEYLVDRKGNMVLNKSDKEIQNLINLKLKTLLI